jgi:hypothetical protein
MANRDTTGSHLLTLKVLRLSRPSFALEDPSSNETQLQMKDYWALSPSFGNIYLGETFTSYLCVNNDSLIAVHDVAFKAELQTGKQRFTLADTVGSGSPMGSQENLPANIDTQNSQVSLLPRQSAEFVLHHEIKDLGIHILVCQVQYLPASMVSNNTKEVQKKFFRKFFKFQVLNPLSVKTKIQNLGSGVVYLEIQMQNLASVPLTVEKMEFEFNPNFHAQCLNKPSEGFGQLHNVFGNSLFNPLDCRQYLYMLRPVDIDVASSITDLGRLDIVWRTTLGQPGHLQTAQLLRKELNKTSFDVTVKRIPSPILPESLFKLTLTIRNNVEGERMQLSITAEKSKMGAIKLKGDHEIELGFLNGLETLDCDLELIAIESGSHLIKGLKLRDAVTGLDFDLETLGYIKIS